MDAIMKWIVDWFVNEAQLDKSVINANLDTNYLSAELIDSFQFIQLIADAEEAFHIEFENEQFEGTKFLSIRGLGEIIDALSNQSA